ncbi:MAG: gamma-glutamylcyclotransferase [Deltaproteobacteria bacterium]|nr:gamma-glutamylcyclotransferase [Deltaproteobacteria bacterium]
MKRFHTRKMNVKELGVAYVDHHQLRFSLANEYKGKGYAGIHPQTGSQVWGVLYEIDDLSLRLLDVLEWAGLGAYERKKLKVVHMPEKQEKPAWSYQVVSAQNNLLPSEQYLQAMVATAIQRNFPAVYIDFLTRHDCKKTFSLDHGFSLWHYGKRRRWQKQLYILYKAHDLLREKLCKLI